MYTRQIPSSGEELPVIGLGTWQTFDAAPASYPRLAEVLRRFSAAGGRVIDSSPMYGKAEGVAGELLQHVQGPFVATKVWTRGRDHGIEQMTHSEELLRTRPLDLIQIHNLLDWRTHLATLRQWKDSGRVRYIGITHYTSGAFEDLERIMRAEALDFVQLPLSAALPDAEENLLPLAQEKGMAVLVNRPFEGGSLFRSIRSKPLPEWVGEFGSRSWGELLLRYVVSHPAVTCAIPATANPDHLDDNVRAGDGRMLTGGERAKLRKRLAGLL